MMPTTSIRPSWLSDDTEPAPAAPPPPTPRPTPPPPPPPVAPRAATPAPARYHGLKTDFQDKVGRERASSFSVLAADADAGKPLTVVKNRRAISSGFPMIAASIVLVILGSSFALGAFFFVESRKPQIPTPLSVPSLIAFDEKGRLEGTSANDLLRALAAASDTELLEGNVMVTYISTQITATSTKEKGIIHVPQPGGTLFKALPLQAPDILIRSVLDESTIGVVRAGGQTRPFFILKVTSYDRSFRGMLSWESTMPRALASLYPSYPVADPLPVAATATTTQATTTTPRIETPRADGFVDSVVRNYDVRVLRDGEGRSLMLYGYRDKETLIIARDEAAFVEIVNRLTAAKGN